MTEQTELVTIRVPAEHAMSTSRHWKELRVADALSAEFDLREQIERENFDGASTIEWVIPLIEAVVPLITGLLGYLVNARGEIEIERNGQTFKFKNLTPSRIREVLNTLEGPASDRSSKSVAEDGEATEEA